MHVAYRHLPVLFWPFLLALGCEAEGVGDPCEPEVVPEGGFRQEEAYLETSSVQCRTRICMVYKLGGDPREGCDPKTTTCADQAQIAEKVYCTCRCGAPSGANARTCDCPSGFRCVEVLELGGNGIRGSYCVRKSDPDVSTLK